MHQSSTKSARPIYEFGRGAANIVSGATCGLHNAKRDQMLEPVDGSAKSAFGRERADVQLAGLIC